MTGKRGRLWEHAEQLVGHLRCKFCKHDSPSGNPRVLEDDVQSTANSKGRKGKSVSQPVTSMPLTDVGSLKASTKTVHDHLYQLFANLVVFDNISPDVLHCPQFARFFRSVANCGPGNQLPSASLIRTKLMPNLCMAVGRYASGVKKSCVLTGCTVILDTWVDSHGTAFLNIILYTLKGAILVKTVELLKNELIDKFVVDQLQSAMDEIGLHNNVVQFIVTDLDNREPLSLRKTLIQRYPGTYVTLCAAHGIQLLFAFIFQEVEWVGRTLCDVKLVNDYMDNYAGSRSPSMRFGGKTELGEVRPHGLFSYFRMVQRIHDAKSEIQHLIASTEWRQLRHLDEETASKLVSIVGSPRFWSQCREVLQVVEPLFGVYCLARTTHSATSYLFEAMERVKKSLKRICDGNDAKYGSVWKLFRGMRAQIIHPVHAAAALLNPSYFLSENFNDSTEIKHGIYYVLRYMVAQEEREAFREQVLLYRKRASKLFTPAAKAMSKASHPYKWWGYCGDDLPVLQKYALLILSQPCSSFSCLECRIASESSQFVKSGGCPVSKSGYCVYLRANTMMMDTFRKLASGQMEPITFEHLSDDHDDYADLEQDRKYNSPKTVARNSRAGDVGRASTEWLTVPSLPASKGEFFQASTHISGAISDALTIEDGRGEFIKKDFPLLPSDYVWILVGVARGKEVHIQLTVAGIITVKDFIDVLSLDESTLRKIVGSGITNDMWKHTLEHANSCVSKSKDYVYYSDVDQQNGIRFNWNYEPKGLIVEGKFLGLESLSRGHKVYLEFLSRTAYQNLGQMLERDVDELT